MTVPSYWTPVSAANVLTGPPASASVRSGSLATGTLGPAVLHKAAHDPHVLHGHDGRLSLTSELATRRLHARRKSHVDPLSNDLSRRTSRYVWSSGFAD